MTSILVSIPYFKKVILVWHELAVFYSYLLFYQLGFCLWVYRLGDLRLLALINAFTSVTIILSYTNVFQSFIISIMTLISYTAVTWYSIEFAGQPGSLVKELFYPLCLFPSFMLISSAAYYINLKRDILHKVKLELETLNYDLSNANEKLIKKQLFAEIEMDLAREIQGAVFPRKAPLVSDWDIAFITKPYSTVSGDFYDFYCMDNALKGISLFDVSGHGIAPALITILAKPILFNHFKRCESLNLGNVIEAANSDLYDELEEVNLYITGLILRINGPEVEYVNAGHPDLIHFQTSAGKVSLMTDTCGSFKGHPIGISSLKQKYLSCNFTLESGDFLIFYSDGFTESRNDMGIQFGVNRLSDAILSSHATNATDLLDYLMESLNNFTGNIKAGDDITVIIAGKI